MSTQEKLDLTELELLKTQLKLDVAVKNLERMVEISEMLQDEPYCLITSKRALEEINKI